MKERKIKPDEWAARIKTLKTDKKTRRKVISLVWWDWCSSGNCEPNNAMSLMYRAMNTAFKGNDFCHVRVYRALRKVGYSVDRARRRCVEPEGTAGWVDKQGNKKVRA